MMQVVLAFVTLGRGSGKKLRLHVTIIILLLNQPTGIGVASLGTAVGVFCQQCRYSHFLRFLRSSFQAKSWTCTETKTPLRPTHIMMFYFGNPHS